MYIYIYIYTYICIYTYMYIYIYMVVSRIFCVGWGICFAVDPITIHDDTTIN